MLCAKKRKFNLIFSFNPKHNPKTMASPDSEKKQSTFEFLQQEVEAWFELFSKSRENTQKHFDEQKEHFGKYVKDFSERLKEKNIVSEAQLEKLQQQWEHLQVQMALGKAEGRDAYEERRKRMKTNFERFKKDFAELESQMERSTEKYNEEFKKEFTHLKAKFEAFQVQAALGRAELSQEAEKKRQEATEKLHEFRKKVKEKQVENEEKVTAFNKEMETSWEHIKKAFQELFG